jgi:hypothetical protein
MSSKSGPVPTEPTVPFDEETTRPVPLQLIARLAAQDPTVQLKIGVLEAVVPGSPDDTQEEPDTD